MNPPIFTKKICSGQLSTQNRAQFSSRTPWHHLQNWPSIVLTFIGDDCVITPNQNKFWSLTKDKGQIFTLVNEIGDQFGEIQWQSIALLIPMTGRLNSGSIIKIWGTSGSDITSESSGYNISAQYAVVLSMHRVPSRKLTNLPSNTLQYLCQSIRRLSCPRRRYLLSTDQ